MRILKKSLNITFINPNTEEQIVQAMAGCLAYNLAENDEKIKFDYKNLTHYSNQRLQVGTPEPCCSCNSNSNTYQNSHEEIEGKLEL